MKSKFKKVTLAHVKKAVDDIANGITAHRGAKSYDQDVWCGTSCCVMGHAWAIAGNSISKDTFVTPEGFSEALDEIEKQRPLLMTMMTNHETEIEDFQAYFKRHPIRK